MAITPLMPVYPRSPVRPVRGEGVYLDGRRPSTVEFGKTLAEDLARRDFTMNAIAYDPIADQLSDPFDGRGDLERDGRGHSGALLDGRAGIVCKRWRDQPIGPAL